VVRCGVGCDFSVSLTIAAVGCDCNDRKVAYCSPLLKHEKVGEGSK